jgi:hypothetical protein
MSESGQKPECFADAFTRCEEERLTSYCARVFLARCKNAVTATIFEKSTVGWSVVQNMNFFAQMPYQ